MHKPQDELDPQSGAFLDRLGEQELVRPNRVPGVRTVLVVLSSLGMVYDIESLRQKILLAYPDSTVFFLNTVGKPIGSTAPQRMDLLVDFTGPGSRQGLFLANRLRRMTRIAVGRNAGFFRKKIYDRVYDEKAHQGELPSEALTRERIVQRKVLNLAGVAFAQHGDTPLDRGKSIALELPPYQKL